LVVSFARRVGAVKRLRPKIMTVAVMFMGLVPIMWSTGAGTPHDMRARTGRFTEMPNLN
jgi:multidrug efflux pump subunit AcrB